MKEYIKPEVEYVQLVTDEPIAAEGDASLGVGDSIFG